MMQVDGWGMLMQSDFRNWFCGNSDELKQFSLVLPFNWKLRNPINFLSINYQMAIFDVISEVRTTFTKQAGYGCYQNLCTRRTLKQKRLRRLGEN